MSPKINISNSIARSSAAGSDTKAKRALAAKKQRQPAVAKERPTTKERKYPCAICDKRFTRPSSLACHKYTHTGERPHVCIFPNCNKRFSVRSNLRRHLKVHAKSSRLSIDAGSPQLTVVSMDDTLTFIHENPCTIEPCLFASGTASPAVADNGSGSGSTNGDCSKASVPCAGSKSRAGYYSIPSASAASANTISQTPPLQLSVVMPERTRRVASKSIATPCTPPPLPPSMLSPLALASASSTNGSRGPELANKDNGLLQPMGRPTPESLWSPSAIPPSLPTTATTVLGFSSPASSYSPPLHTAASFLGIPMTAPITIQPTDQIYPNPDQYLSPSSAISATALAASVQPPHLFPVRSCSSSALLTMGAQQQQQQQQQQAAGSCCYSQLVPKLASAFTFPLPYYADNVYSINTQSLDFIHNPSAIDQHSSLLATPTTASSTTTSPSQLFAPFSPVFSPLSTEPPQQ